MLMPRGLPVPTYVQPYRRLSALGAVVSPIGSIQPEAVVSPNSSVVGEPLSIWATFPQCARRGI